MSIFQTKLQTRKALLRQCLFYMNCEIDIVGNSAYKTAVKMGRPGNCSLGKVNSGAVPRTSIHSLFFLKYSIS